MKIICNLFGHSWKCYMGFKSYCRHCGIDYTEYWNSLSKSKQKEIDKETKNFLKKMGY